MIWNRIRRDLERGAATVLMVGRYLAERTRVETALAKVVFDSRKIQKKIEEKTLELGERVFELRDERPGIQDAVVRDLLAGIEELKREQELYLSRIRDLGGGAVTEDAAGDPGPPSGGGAEDGADAPPKDG